MYIRYFVFGHSPCLGGISKKHSPLHSSMLPHSPLLYKKLTLEFQNITPNIELCLHFTGLGLRRQLTNTHPSGRSTSTLDLPRPPSLQFMDISRDDNTRLNQRMISERLHILPQTPLQALLIRLIRLPKPAKIKLRRRERRRILPRPTARLRVAERRPDLLVRNKQSTAI